jgi:membrane protease YdiL (CAAX protease family)
LIDEPVRPSRKPTVWGLLVVSLGSALVAPLLALALVATFGPGLTGDEQSFLAQVIGNWLCVLVIIGIVIGGERLPLVSIGFQGPKWRDLGLGVAGWLVALFATAALASRYTDINEGPIEQLLALSLWIRLALFITAPITEEILFRGYALERLAMLTRNMWVAAAITTVFFVLLHAPFYGLEESLLRIPVTIVLTLLYIRTRSIWTVIVMHLLFDMPLLFAGSLPTS